MNQEEVNLFIDFLKNNYSSTMECIQNDIYTKNWFYRFFYKRFSTPEYIFKYVQKKYKISFKSLEMAFKFFYEREINNFEHNRKEEKNKILSFLIENNMEETFFSVNKEGDNTYIGDYTQFAERKVKKNKDLEEDYVFDNYFYDNENSYSDYDTLIEIITIDAYIVPCYKITKIKEGYYFVERVENKDLRFSKESKHYDPRRYGTHYM